jgi:hypothetical protein
MLLCQRFGHQSPPIALIQLGGVSALHSHCRDFPSEEGVELDRAVSSLQDAE